MFWCLDNIWRFFLVFVEKKKNGEGKGGKCLEKEIIWSTEEKKKNGEGKGGIIWRRKINGDTNQRTD